MKSGIISVKKVDFGDFSGDSLWCSVFVLLKKMKIFLEYSKEGEMRKKKAKKCKKTGKCEKFGFLGKIRENL